MDVIKHQIAQAVHEVAAKMHRLAYLQMENGMKLEASDVMGETSPQDAIDVADTWSASAWQDHTGDNESAVAWKEAEEAATLSETARAAYEAGDKETAVTSSSEAEAMHEKAAKLHEAEVTRLLRYIHGGQGA